MQRNSFGDYMQTRQLGAMLCLVVLMGPLIGSLSIQSSEEPKILENGVQYLPNGQTLDLPEQDGYGWIVDQGPWWDRSSLDLDRNKIHDSLQTLTIPTGIGLSYSTDVTDAHLNDLSALGLNIVDVIESVDAVLLQRQAARPGDAGVGVVARSGACEGGAHLQGERVGGSVGPAHDELLRSHAGFDPGGTGCAGGVTRHLIARLGRARGAGLCLRERLQLHWPLSLQQRRRRGGCAGGSERGRQDAEPLDRGGGAE